MKYVLRACLVEHDTKNYVRQLIKAAKFAKIDEIMFCEDNIFIGGIAQPFSAHEKHAAVLKKAVKEVKAAGIECSFYLKAFVGHFESSAFALPYTKFVGDDGVASQNECCLLDGDFVKFAEKIFTLYAGCGFSAMMLDDDFRSINHRGGRQGCFCDLHVKAASALYKKPLTRERLIAASRAFDEKSAKIKKAFRAANFNGQKKMAESISRAIHSVNSDIRVGLMCSGIGADEVQGRGMYELLRAFAGEGRKPYLRPPGGAYYDEAWNIFAGWREVERYKAYFADAARLDKDESGAEYISEVDIYSPRNIFTKSVKMLDLQIAFHVLAGYNAVSLNIIDHFGTPPKQAIEYFELLRDKKSEYEEYERLAAGKTPYGIGFPVRQGAVAALKSSRFGATGDGGYDYILMRMGFPVQFTEGEVNFLSAEATYAYSDDEIGKLLKKSVILDNEAARILIGRGFGEKIGVTDLTSIGEACFEEYSDGEIFGEYAGYRYPASILSAGGKLPYRLNLAVGAKPLSVFKTAELKEIGAATSYFENSAGGKVLVFGTEISGDGMYNKGRVYGLKNVLKKMFGGVLPLETEGGVKLIPFCFVSAGGKADFAAVYNCSYDEQETKITFGGKTFVERFKSFELKVFRK